MENAQVAVCLTYATDAGVPPDVEFATKPTLARQMIACVLDAGVGARWVAGDEVYGARPITAWEEE